MEIKRQPVESSIIRSVGYDPPSQTLHVEFSSGDTFEYQDVPIHRYQGLVSAPSQGKFFHAMIRGRHPHRKL